MIKNKYSVLDVFKRKKAILIGRILIIPEAYKEKKEGSCELQIHPALDVNDEDKKKLQKLIEGITDILRVNVVDVDKL